MSQAQATPLAAKLHSLMTSMGDAPHAVTHKQVQIVRMKSVDMPSAVYELTRDFAGTMHLPHDAFLAMVWEKMAHDLSAAMNAVIENRAAEGDVYEAEEKLTVAQERSHVLHDKARALVDAIVGTDIPLVL